MLDSTEMLNHVYIHNPQLHETHKSTKQLDLTAYEAIPIPKPFFSVALAVVILI